jgi:AcrR family transcriptional regulator
MKKKKKRKLASSVKGSFELLWNITDQPGRGPKPVLSLENTVHTAVKIADAEGLAALTMNRVAAQLGVTTMALYRYVSGKDQLIDLIIDAVMINAPEPREEGWRAGMTKWAKEELAMYLAHQWLFEAVVTRPTLGPNWVKWLDAALHALSSLNLTTSQKMSVLLLVDGHVRSIAQIMTGAKGSREWEENFKRMLQLVSQNQNYPTITRMVNAGAFNEPGEDFNDIFEFGLQRLLDGVEGFTVVGPAQPFER